VKSLVRSAIVAEKCLLIHFIFLTMSGRISRASCGHWAAITQNIDSNHVILYQI